MHLEMTKNWCYDDSEEDADDAAADLEGDYCVQLIPVVVVDEARLSCLLVLLNHHDDELLMNDEHPL